MQVFYDRDCGFCRWTVGWLVRIDRRAALEPLPIQSQEGERVLGDLDAPLASWHIVDGDSRYSGGLAFVPLAGALPGAAVFRPLTRLLAPLLVKAYDWVAGHRSTVSRLVPARSRHRADSVLDERERGRR
jgi:predicted DCC family thiol-disulfide oxidoreductase YuxK